MSRRHVRADQPDEVGAAHAVRQQPVGHVEPAQVLVGAYRVQLTGADVGAEAEFFEADPVYFGLDESK